MAACRIQMRTSEVLVVLLVVAMCGEGQHRPPSIHRPPSSQVVDGVQRFRQVLRLYKDHQRDTRAPEIASHSISPVPSPSQELRPPGLQTRPQGPSQQTLGPPIRPPESSLQPPGLPKRLPISHSRPLGTTSRPTAPPNRITNNTQPIIRDRPPEGIASHPSLSRRPGGVSRVPKRHQPTESERNVAVAVINPGSPGGSSPINGLDETRYQKPLGAQNNQQDTHKVHNFSRQPSDTLRSPENYPRRPARGPQVSEAVTPLGNSAVEAVPHSEIPWDRGPEIPRVPDIPIHLPLDLTNRLKEFPKLAESLDEAPVAASMHSFFEPKIEVQAEELSDEEWEEYLASEWGHEGVVPDLLTLPPPFLANLKYGDHLCVHLGNPLTPAQTRTQPMSLQFPSEARRRYTIMLLNLGPQQHPNQQPQQQQQQQQQTPSQPSVPLSSEYPPHRRPPHTHTPTSFSSSTQDDPLTLSSFPRLLWFLINVPPDQPNKGETVVEYEGPRPGQGTGRHRLVVLVYEQQRSLHLTNPHLPPAARSCQAEGREGVDVTQLARHLSLQGPVAGNYFTSEWDVTVEHACPPSPSHAQSNRGRQCDPRTSMFPGGPVGSDPSHHQASTLCS